MNFPIPGDLLRAGDIIGAARHARALLAGDPENADAQHALGIEALSRGAIGEALTWLQRAVANDPGVAWFWCNLAHAHLQTGPDHAIDAGTAIDAARHALALKPDYAQAGYNLGCALLVQGLHDEATSRFRSLVERFPDNVEYLCAFADARRLSGQWRDAVRLYRKVLESNPDHVRAESNLGALLANFGESETALEHCQRAVEKAPDSWQVHRLLGRCQYQLEAFDEAMDAYASAFELNAESAELCIDIARVWQETGDLAESASWYQRALALAADDPSARAGLASILLDQGDTSAARELLASAIETNTQNMEVLRVNSLCLWHDGDADGAIAQLRAAQDVQPNNASLHALSGQVLASAGQVELAHLAYALALDLNPRCVGALGGLASSQRGAMDPALADRMRELLENPRLRDGSKAGLHNGLAHYHDGLAHWQEAAEQMALANRCQWQHRDKRGQTYDADAHVRRCEKIRAVFDTCYFERVVDFGKDSEVPAFIVGMPRSGTTLTEQILARHPHVLGIGERNFASQSFQALATLPVASDSADDDELGLLGRLSNLDAAATRKIARRYLDQLESLAVSLGLADARRILDKMPDNYSHVGWIATLFPRARIIHCRRDLRDVALSCWLTHFGKITWASRWQDLLDRIREYELMMQHWRFVLPGRFLEIDYETTVANQETQARQLVDWLGLEWDPACLEHYAGDGLVRTASVTQVREPIYTRSVARWEHYLPHIPELGEIRAKV